MQVIELGGVSGVGGLPVTHGLGPSGTGIFVSGDQQLAGFEQSAVVAFTAPQGIASWGWLLSTDNFTERRKRKWKMQWEREEESKQQRKKDREKKRKLEEAARAAAAEKSRGDAAHTWLLPTPDPQPVRVQPPPPPVFTSVRSFLPGLSQTGRAGARPPLRFGLGRSRLGGFGQKSELGFTPERRVTIQLTLAGFGQAGTVWEEVPVFPARAYQELAGLRARGALHRERPGFPIAGRSALPGFAQRHYGHVDGETPGLRSQLEIERQAHQAAMARADEALASHQAEAEAKAAQEAAERAARIERLTADREREIARHRVAVIEADLGRADAEDDAEIVRTMYATLLEDQGLAFARTLEAVVIPAPVEPPRPADGWVFARVELGQFAQAARAAVTDPLANVTDEEFGAVVSKPSYVADRVGSLGEPDDLGEPEAQPEDLTPPAPDLAAVIPIDRKKREFHEDPVREVSPGRWRWGKSGKTYKSKAAAQRQAAAIYASGWRGDALRAKAAPLKPSPRAETRYALDLQQIMKAVHAAALHIVHRELKPHKSELHQDSIGDAKSRLHKLSYQLAPWLRMHVANAFNRMSGEVRTHSGTAAKLVGVPLRQSLSLDRLIDETRQANVNLITNASSTFLDQVRDVLDEYGDLPAGRGAGEERLADLEEGAVPRMLSEALQQRVDVSKSRAQTIARDQVIRLNSKVHEKRARSAGTTHYRWSTSRDERVSGDPSGKYPKAEPSHFDRDGKVFAWDDPPDEDSYDGHPGQNRPNCRCVALPIIDELEDDDTESEPEPEESSDDDEAAEG